jgi:ribosome-binding factor A
MLMLVIRAIIVIVEFSKPLSLADVFYTETWLFQNREKIFSEGENFASVIIRQLLQKSRKKKAANL